MDQLTGTLSNQSIQMDKSKQTVYDLDYMLQNMATDHDTPFVTHPAVFKTYPQVLK